MDKTQPHPLFKLATELGPLLVFFFVNAKFNLFAATGDPAAHRRMILAGFARGSEFTWNYHYSYYWDLTQRVYREELDPAYDGDTHAGTPFCPSGTPECDGSPIDWAAITPIG